MSTKTKETVKELTPWQTFFDKDYLGSHNFDDGEKKEVVVASAGKRSVKKPGGKADDCLVVVFEQPKQGEGIKPLVTNVTNAKAIQKISGSRHIENWAGTKLTLYVDTNVKFAGKTVEGIRVLVDGNMKPQKDHMHKGHAKWGDCVKGLVKGYEMKDIRKKYNVAASVAKELVKAAAAMKIEQDLTQTA